VEREELPQVEREDLPQVEREELLQVVMVPVHLALQQA
jgi:hypothetical protein